MKKYVVSLILVGLFLFGCGKGNTTFDDLKSLDVGISTDKVIEYIGEPKSKTIDKDEIYNWAPDSLIKQDSFSELEMYVYKMDDGKEAHLFFSKGQLIYKKPLGLNNIS
ncbi:hypothetical protein IGJ55_002133 [Enterococcus sp. AZ170]|uniref:hypothetical protein n=1 Tax=unclassified Enterococcus TaxID=2608891 RepID=UPI003D2D7962